MMRTCFGTPPLSPGERFLLRPRTAIGPRVGVFREVEDHPLHCPHRTFLLHAGLARTHRGSVFTDPRLFWWLGADQPNQQATTSLAGGRFRQLGKRKMTLPGSI